jgi:hypothetical protein
VLHHFGHERVKETMKRCTGKDWWRGFQKRYPSLSKQSRKRAIEQHRAMKTQPEITVKFWRLLLHTYALMMIHRAIATGLFFPPNCCFSYLFLYC